MSSHHIIREDQEPALLVMDVRGADFVHVQELLEWSPTVIVSAQVLEEVLRWGIKIDIVIAQEENISSLATSLVDQSPVKLIPHNNKKDALSTALDFLISSKQKAVNIITNLPLRILNYFLLSIFRSFKREDVGRSFGVDITKNGFQREELYAYFHRMAKMKLKPAETV